MNPMTRHSSSHADSPRALGPGCAHASSDDRATHDESTTDLSQVVSPVTFASAFPRRQRFYHDESDRETSGAVRCHTSATPRHASTAVVNDATASALATRVVPVLGLFPKSDDYDGKLRPSPRGVLEMIDGSDLSDDDDDAVASEQAMRRGRFCFCEDEWP